MTTLTTKELEYLKAIDISEYGDALNDAIWTWSIADNISSDIDASSLGGIASSLSKKGFIGICEESDPDDCSTNMTEAGMDIYCETAGTERAKHRYHADGTNDIEWMKANSKHWKK